MIYRFNKPINLSDGSILGNANIKKGPLGGECFFDAVEDNEIQNKVREQIALQEKEAAELVEKKSKTK